MTPSTRKVDSGSGSGDVVGSSPYPINCRSYPSQSAAVPTPAESATRWRTQQVQDISTTSTDRRVKGIWQPVAFKGSRLLPRAAAAAAAAAIWH